MLIDAGKVIHKRDTALSYALPEEKQIVSLPVGALCLSDRFSRVLTILLFLIFGPLSECFFL